MKRLIHKANNDVPAMYSTKPMMELSTLDAADVKSDRCPICRNSTLQNIKGFKICDICGTNFKVFNKKVYICDVDRVNATGFFIDETHY